MANSEHCSLARGGSGGWNKWRKQNPTVQPDLGGADLSMATARRAALNRALLLHGLGGGVHDLSGFDLHGADLSGENLSGQILTGANLSRADLSGANLEHAHLVEVNLREAKLNGCRVFGISTWDVDLTGAEQKNLIINPEDEPTITVDYLEVAQFVYLLLNNAKIRDVIDTITAKAVLILGRFTPERKTVLNAIRESLRSKGYLPILFDFERPAGRDITETVSTLAHMSRFIVADITDVRSIPQELAQIVPHLPSVPVQPLLQASASEYGMFEHFKRYPWVLDAYRYAGEDEVIANMEQKIIAPCEVKALEMRKVRNPSP